MRTYRPETYTHTEILDDTVEIELNVRLIEGKYDAPEYTIPSS